MGSASFTAPGEGLGGRRPRASWTDEHRPSDQGQLEAVTIRRAQPGPQRPERSTRGRHTASSDSPGGRNRGSKCPQWGQRECALQRECPEYLGSWRPGQDRGRGLPTVGAVLTAAGPAGKSVSSPIRSSFPPSFPLSSCTGSHRGLHSQLCVPSAFPGTRGTAGQGSVSPASGQRSSRLRASEGLQILQAWPDSSCLLPVRGRQGLICTRCGRRSLTRVPAEIGPRPTLTASLRSPLPGPAEEEEALSPGATGLPSSPQVPGSPSPHAPCQSLGLALRRHSRQEGQHCPLPGACVLWGRRANSDEGTQSDTAVTWTVPRGRGVV